MPNEKFLVTGALGCIGAWVVKHLVAEGVPVWTYDLPGNPHRLKLIMDDASIGKVNMVHGDITDYTKFESTVGANGITHIVHLAALQVPFVKADPLAGARVNVVGTGVVLEAARKHAAHVRSLALASSVAVYAGTEFYPPGPLKHDAVHFPQNLYGVFKHCNEDQARIYWQDWGVRSIGIRPYVIYGPGRDQGMTSTPSKGMAAAAAGRDYQISYGGTALFQLASDAARAFIQASRAGYSGASTYNLGGSLAHMNEVVEAIRTSAPGSKLTFNPAPLAIAENVEGAPLEAVIGKIPWTPLADGVRDSVAIFKHALAAGRLDVDRLLA